MSGELTVGWERGERIGLPVPDSSFVYPEPALTVGWVPLINPTILDYDPDAFVVAPVPGDPDPYAEPALFVADRIAARRLGADGLRFGIRAEAEATIRARLVAIVPQRRGEPKERVISKIVTATVGAERESFRLRLSPAGRKLVRRDPSFRARVEVVARYEGQRPYRLSEKLKVYGRPKRSPQGSLAAEADDAPPDED